ncbi:hypothetical protein IVA80_10975 [Bradyrhizobium sp. 139]|uniref:hypothetical protein n=1 Tax=Bradyrhizobium sp. 139 TaxID=2782616 RepID=UPI001FF983BB|nr:hypothetical protein [Bradyrhizobium sp. 139]MCK1741373.1 hypothetical protein [Bradyrhizobium sp. 139]
MRPTTNTLPSDSEETAHLRTRVRDLELVLGLRDESLVATFRLTPVLNNVLGLLLNVPAVTPEMVRQRLEIAHDAKVAIHRLRKHMLPYGITVQSRRNVGYWLDDEAKMKIRDMIREQLAGAPVPPHVVVDNTTAAPQPAAPDAVAELPRAASA